MFAGAGEVSHLDVADMHAQVAERDGRLLNGSPPTRAGAGGAAAADGGAGLGGPSAGLRAAGRCGAVAVACARACGDVRRARRARRSTGGPTLNPSTYELLAAIHEVPAEEVVVLPNSPNVVMAAERAAELSEKQVLVVPSRSQQASLAAAVELLPDRPLEQNAQALPRRSRGCVPAPSPRPPATTWTAASPSARRSGFSARRSSPGASPAPRCAHVLVALGDGSELITCSPARARRSSAAASPRCSTATSATSSSSSATAGSRLLVAGGGRVVAGGGQAPLPTSPHVSHRLVVAGPGASSDCSASHHVNVPAASASLAPAPLEPVPTRAAPALRAFGSARAATRAELLSAPVRWPQPARLREPLDVSARRLAEGLRALGVESVGALLEHLPRDRREARAIAQLRPGEQATVAVEVRSIAARPVRRRGMRPLVEAVVFDETGAMGAAFFNQPWLADRYRPGTRLLLHGRARPGGRFAVVHHAPAGGGATGGEDSGALAGEEATGAIAHYPATEGVSSTQLAALVRTHRGALADVAEPLPAAVRAAERLPDRAAALAAMHFPRAAEEAERGRARLAFEELLLAQLAILRRRALRGGGSAVALAGERQLTARWLQELPFAPTAGQGAALAALDADLARDRPMQRLLMGEVGSGKTVVALYALLRAVEHGAQGALMAPTETLAEQHFATLQALVSDLLPAALLTGSTPGRRRAEILGRLASGELPLVVGTHALLEEDVRFARLAVAVVDEQHRFGVRQRVALDRKGGWGSDHLAPHVLHMTATPIPRTLALTEYGDLDVTRLRELPRGRRPIATHVASGERERARAYERLREELRAGRQAYVVCPLVEESAELQARAATAECERLRVGELRDFRLELLHGQLRPAEKRAAMARFAAGEAHVLVATTVIEVGVDVPNATMMVVEDAERYGLSQLHQLRGRIGRGEHPSVCILFGPRHARRLRALAEHEDGFRLAEIDLELRGEGELAGTRQHGAAEPRVASLPGDAALLERAREWAERLLAADPELACPEHVPLREALEGALGREAHEPLAA